jgi:hypothetical protein
MLVTGAAPRRGSTRGAAAAGRSEPTIGDPARVADVCDTLDEERRFHGRLGCEASQARSIPNWLAAWLDALGCTGEPVGVVPRRREHVADAQP